ncbi:unnamed protein product [Miscanthus lutarioriparius]|uniref:PGG domain-containing protein n=1 Tax=Miscanthus lutarioriparius TaxID=422564 RepID=A0A811M834_9POAL|nr:unnamed protein product [Miscanthus lutarioriparius]
MYPRVNPDALPAPGSLEMGHATHAVAYPPPPPTAEVVPVPMIQQRHGGRAPDRSSCEDHDPSTLLVGATLITMLAFLLGSSVPGGYWPQDTPSGDGSGRLYRAGDPIMRDLHRPRYWVFRVASWAGVASSMVLTLSLLVRMAVASRHVRWSFAVAYASLLLTFAASQTRTHLSLDILLCLAVLLVSWLITSVREENRACVMKVLCCSSSRDS